MSKLVRDVMTPDPVFVGPETTLQEVAEVLSSNHIGGVPVVTGAEHLVGVVSATDLMEFITSSPGVPTVHEDHAEWGEPMQPPEEDVAQEPGRYYTDLWPDAGADVLERFDSIGGPEWVMLAEHMAEEIMTRVVLTVTPDDGVAEAAQRMLEHGVHRLFVVEDGRLAGIVTTRDLIALVAAGEITT